MHVQKQPWQWLEYIYIQTMTITISHALLASSITGTFLLEQAAALDVALGLLYKN